MTFLRKHIKGWMVCNQHQLSYGVQTMLIISLQRPIPYLGPAGVVNPLLLLSSSSPPPSALSQTAHRFVDDISSAAAFSISSQSVSRWKVACTQCNNPTSYTLSTPTKNIGFHHHHHDDDPMNQEKNLLLILFLLANNDNNI